MTPKDLQPYSTFAHRQIFPSTPWEPLGAHRYAFLKRDVQFF
ncbi:MAG: hypothetical protein V4642_04620 [Bacteroidota bacterium]